MKRIGYALVSLVIGTSWAHAEAPKQWATDVAIKTTGVVKQRAFAPKGGVVFGKLAANGNSYVVVSLEEGPLACEGSRPKAGSWRLIVPVPIQVGAKVDLAKANFHGNWNPSRLAQADEKGNWASFVEGWSTPTGSATTLAMPTTKGATGRIAIDLHMDAFAMKGELPILVCTAL